MTVYRYMTSDLLTGNITGDWIEMIPQNFSRVISGAGTGTCAVNLAAAKTTAQARSWLAAVEIEKSVLWVFQDGAPCWVGIIWDQPHQSILDNTLPLSVSTPESIFQKRQIVDDLTFTGQDVFDVFRALVTYALSLYTNGGMARLSLGSGHAGVPVTVSYTGTDRQAVYDALNALAATYGFEWAIRPAVDVSGAVSMVLDLGYPQLGQDFAGSQLTFSMPGNLLDYRYPRTGSTAATLLTVTAQGNSAGDGTNWVSALPHGEDTDALAAGYPLLMQSASLTTVAVTEQGQVDGYADGLLAAVKAGQVTPLLITGAGVRPAAKDIVLGSECQFTATSALHPVRDDGTPGLQVQARIVGWQLYPSSSTQTESNWVQLGEVVDVSS